jgi:Gpi18-like mannosyltransferase
MGGKIRLFLILAAITIIPTFLVWLPFILRFETFWAIPLPQTGMATIVANYDGPIYIALAKTLYNTEEIAANFSFPLPLEYYAAHFPLFPLLIRIAALITVYPYAMLSITIASSLLTTYFFYKLISDHVRKSEVLWITAFFAVFPARWLIVRSVGSPEPLFLASIIASVYYFNKKKYLSAGVWGAIAQFVKPPGILLFIAFVLAIAFPTLKKSALSSFSKIFTHLNLQRKYPIFFIPIALLIIFLLYNYTFNNFFAYFNSGDNIHLFFPPFQIFNFAQPWVNTFWLEEIIFIYLAGVLGFLKLLEKKEYNMAWFVGIFFTSIIFVSHRDVLRYALPIIPFLFVAYSGTITARNFKIAMVVIAIPIYLYSIVYISQNVMPISDWAPLL